MKIIGKIGIRNLFVILGGILFSIGAFVLASTYSKYVTGTTGNADVRIARWKIRVNNQDVINNYNISSLIQPVFPGNTNIASGVIAPTAEGYFDIVIDGTNTDVSFNYEITTSENEDSAVSDLVLSGYSIDGGQRQTINSQNGQLSLTDSISYDQVDKEISVRVYFMWNDDENDGATMDNTDDTNATKSDDNLAIINVNVRFVQIANNQASNNQNANNQNANNGQ